MCHKEMGAATPGEYRYWSPICQWKQEVKEVWWEAPGWKLDIETAAGVQEDECKNCVVAGQKLENLSKGGMVWEQTVYRKGFLPCCMLAASAVKAPRLAIPLASSNELTKMSVLELWGQHYMAPPAQLHAYIETAWMWEAVESHRWGWL